MLASASITPRAGGLEGWNIVSSDLCLGVAVVGRVERARNFQHRVTSLKASTNSTMHHTPQLSGRASGPAGSRIPLARCDPVCFSKGNKADGWDKTGVRLADSAMMRQ